MLAAPGLVGIPLAALIGGLVGALTVYLLAWRRGMDGYRLVLVGIGVSAVCTNVKYWLLTVGDVNDTGKAMVWITGSLNGRGWEHVVPVSLALAVLIPLTLLGTRSLGALRFGDDTVTGLGVRMNLTRGLMILAAVLLAATATASAGPIAFVALAAPQIALRLAGVAQPPLVVSALVGSRPDHRRGPDLTDPVQPRRAAGGRGHRRPRRPLSDLSPHPCAQKGAIVRLKAVDLKLGYGDRIIVDGLDLGIEAGR